MVFPQMSARTTSRETTAFFETRTDPRRRVRVPLAQRPDEAQHLDGVAARIDPVEHVPHQALLVDDEGRARDAGLSAAVAFLLVYHSVLPADLALGIRQQPDRNSVLVPEPGVAQAVIPTHPQHHAIVAGKLLFLVGE